jgi:hypothetical protein
MLSHDYPSEWVKDEQIHYIEYLKDKTELDILKDIS